MRVLSCSSSFQQSFKKNRFYLFLIFFTFLWFAPAASAHGLSELLEETSVELAVAAAIFFIGATVLLVIFRISSLKMHQRMFFDVAEGLGQAFWFISGKKTVYVSPSFETICGCSFDDFLRMDKKYLISVISDDRELLIQSLQKHFSKQKADLKTEFRVQQLHRHDRWVELQAFNRTGSRGGQWNSMGVLRDITEHKRELISSQQQESSYRQLIQNANSAIIRMDAKGRITFFNEFSQKFFGYTEKEILGKSVIGTIISAEIMSQDELVLVINQIANQGSDFHFRENENIKKDGTRVWVSWSNRGIFDDKGDLLEILCVGVDETQQKQARQEVEENRRLLDMAVRGAYLGVFDRDIRSGKMVFNDIWWRMLGFNKNELSEHVETWQSLLHPEDREFAEKILQDYLQGRRPYYVSEYRMRAKDGSWRWILDRGQIIERDAAGSPLRMVGLHQDITVRKNAETERERLLRSLNRLTAVMNNTSDFVSISNMEGKIIYINDAGSRMLGIENAGEILGRMSWKECHPKNIVEQIESVWLPKAVEVGTWSAESMIVKQDGSSIPVVQVLIPIYDEKGTVEAVGTTMADISEIKRFQNTLKDQTFKLQEAQQVARLGHWEIDPEKKSFFRSEIVAEIFGTDPGRQAKTYDEFLKFIHPDDRAHVDVILMHSIHNKTTEEMVLRILRADGQTRYVQAKCQTVEDVQTRRLRCTGTLQDVTDMKKGEEALRYQKELLTTLIENMPLAVYAKDVQDNYRFIMWNKEMERMFGLKRNKVLGKNDHDLFDRALADFYRIDDEQVIDSHAIKEMPNATIHTVFGDRHAYTVKIPIYNSDGKATILFGILEDITNRLDMESQLRQNQKMQAVGQLAAGVAHEVKNPLAIILLAAEGLALNKIAVEDPRFQNKLRMIKEAAERANRVVMELLKFSRLSSGDDEAVDLHQALEGAEFLVKSKAQGKNINFVHEYASDSIMIRGNEVLLQQVFFNFFSNAVDAIEAKGTIKVRTARKKTAAKSNVIIEISDTGKGIPKDILGKIFDPFFTTKEPGMGTGLGLSTAFMIVERYNGTIKVESEVGQGTTFCIICPDVAI